MCRSLLSLCVIIVLLCFAHAQEFSTVSFPKPKYEYQFNSTSISNSGSIKNGGFYADATVPHKGTITLDGTKQQYIDLGSINDLGGAKSWSASIWVKVSDSDVNNQAFSRFFEFSSGSRGKDSVVIARSANSNGITFRVNNGVIYNASYIDVANVIVPNTWMLLTVTQSVNLNCSFLDSRDLSTRATSVAADGTSPWDKTRSSAWNVENQRKICSGRGMCFNELSGGSWCYKPSAVVTNITKIATNPMIATTRIYKDGILIAVKDMLVPSLVNRNFNYIGKSGFAGDKYLTGSVDYFGLWVDRALSTPDIGSFFVNSLKDALLVRPLAIVTKYQRDTGSTSSNVTVSQIDYDSYVFVKTTILQSTDAKLTRKLSTTTTTTKL